MVIGLIFLFQYTFKLKWPNVNRRIRSFKKGVFWNGYLTLTAEIYMDMVVSCIINIKISKWDDISGIILYTNILSYVGLAALILIPIVSFVHLYRNRKTWEEPSWRNKYGALVDEMILYKRKSDFLKISREK